MGAFSNLKYGAQDVWQQLRVNKTRVVLCCVCAVGGIGLGIALFYLSYGNWWYCNRCEFAQSLWCSGFGGILAKFLFASLLVCASLWCVTLWKWSKNFCYLVLLIASLYCGANCCAFFVLMGGWGVLYVLLVLLVEQLINMLCCFLTSCICACRRTVKEAFRECKGIFILQGCCVLLKLLLVFLILRPLFALL